MGLWTENSWDLLGQVNWALFFFETSRKTLIVGAELCWNGRIRRPLQWVKESSQLHMRSKTPRGQKGRGRQATVSPDPAPASFALESTFVKRGARMSRRVLCPVGCANYKEMVG